MALSRPLAPEEYLRLERKSEERHEYLKGEIFAMSGASRAHNLIAQNTSRILGNQIEDRPCEVYQSDMRVKIQATGLYTYPDIVVVCDSPEFEDQELDTLINPTVIIEVLSASTEKYDRGKKFQHYRSITTLQEYILISQEMIHVEQYVRQKDQWGLRDFGVNEAILNLTSIGCSIQLADIYRKVSFETDQGLQT